MGRINWRREARFLAEYREIYEERQQLRQALGEVVALRMDLTNNLRVLETRLRDLSGR